MENIIEVKRLQKEYNGFLALDDVSLRIKKGRIYGLLGRNGAGKTTIMKSILGLTFPSIGKIYIKGSPMNYKNKEQFSTIGSMIETPAFYSNLSARENLELFALIRGVTEKGAIEKALDLVGLESSSNKTFDSFSMGMKQRLGIANALLHEPEILILDEPTNGLDPMGIVEIRSILINLCKEFNKTILISSHILSEVEKIADDIAFIEKGKVIEESSMENIRNKCEQYTSYVVSNVYDSARLLEENYDNPNYIVISNRKIRVFGLDDKTNEINRLLTNNGIDVFQINTQNESLEDYFKKITGGDDN
ncbi:MAG: ABC transporter ATP-binding protein [Clostridiaceae bacterium]|nr:ABC transporter ATP-binding protein [Clostridiaceae bacterium]MBW4859539.1 ABC transporter ATP-binding protein [Clostridiaceae bacterium]MBW4867384.1 ABC transporter ATP-binding protein [Clostridiaceae bacterium]